MKERDTAGGIKIPPQYIELFTWSGLEAEGAIGLVLDREYESIQDVKRLSSIRRGNLIHFKVASLGMDVTAIVTHFTISTDRYNIQAQVLI